MCTASETLHQCVGSLIMHVCFFVATLLLNCLFCSHSKNGWTSKKCFHSYCFENLLFIKHISSFLIYTSFSGSQFTFLPACVWWPQTTEIWTCMLRAVCLHLSKSGVNWILLYVLNSDYKCKVACTELYIPLLWGPTLPHCSIKAQDDGSASWEENNQ